MNIKIRFNDFKQTTVECRANQLDQQVFADLLQIGYQRRQLPVRLIGLGIGLGDKKTDEQLALF